MNRQWDDFNTVCAKLKRGDSIIFRCWLASRFLKEVWTAARNTLGNAENYSGFENNDAEDFIKRVNETLAKLKGPAPSEPATPSEAK
jgi:hypothetical protein